MVILVDDEDDRDGEHQQFAYETRSASRWGSNFKAETPLCDENRQRANGSDVSTGIWSDTAEHQSSGETGRPKKRRPMFRQPSQMGDSAQQLFAVGPGPKAGRQAYSVTPDSEPQIAADEGKRTLIVGADNRPTSQGSTSVPVQDTMQPKIKIAGRPSFDADGARKAPINMPGRSSAERETSMDARPSARRTYKSLSPYSILFED